MRYQQKHKHFTDRPTQPTCYLAVLILETGQKGKTVSSFQKAQQHILFPSLFFSAMRYFLENSITKIAVAVAKVHWKLFSSCYLDIRVPNACSLRQISILQQMPYKKNDCFMTSIKRHYNSTRYCLVTVSAASKHHQSRN